MSNISSQQTNDGQYIWPVDGSRHASEEALRAHAEPMIAKLEKLAGHPLDERHLMNSPVRHADDRTLRQKIVDDATRAVKSPEQKPINPFQHALDARRKAKMSQDDILALKAEEWEAKKAAEDKAKAEKELLNSNPEYGRAVQHAKTELLYLKFDPSIG
jgi:hypothetical protein